MNTIHYSTVRSLFGEMGVAISSKGLCGIFFPEEAPFEKKLKKIYPLCTIVKNDALCKPITKQLQEYFAGKRIAFDIKIDLQAPPFYKKALLAVKKIPFGKTMTYKEIARKAGNPKAVRAAGSANAYNPIPIVIPCHRVINTGGGLGGYSGNIQHKALLLELEGVL